MIYIHRTMAYSQTNSLCGATSNPKEKTKSRQRHNQVTYLESKHSLAIKQRYFTQYLNSLISHVTVQSPKNAFFVFEEYSLYSL